jgi:hypothetical protein
MPKFSLSPIDSHARKEAWRGRVRQLVDEGKMTNDSIEKFAQKWTEMDRERQEREAVFPILFSLFISTSIFMVLSHVCHFAIVSISLDLPFCIIITITIFRLRAVISAFPSTMVFADASFLPSHFPFIQYANDALILFQLLSGRNSNREDVVLNMEQIERQNLSLNSSNRLADEIISTGNAVLSSLSSQRDQIKKTRTKILDVMNQLGLSRSLIRVIERRMWSDNMIMYSGMALTLIVCGLAYWYFRG